MRYYTKAASVETNRRQWLRIKSREIQDSDVLVRGRRDSSELLLSLLYCHRAYDLVMYARQIVYWAAADRMSTALLDTVFQSPFESP